MKQTPWRFILGASFLLVTLSFNNAYAFEEIRLKHQRDLDQTITALAKSPGQQQKATLLWEKAQALDTLGQHAAALSAIDESLSIKPSIGAILTKAIILRSTGDLKLANEPLAIWFATNKGNSAAISTMLPLMGEIQLQRAISSIRLQNWEAAMFYAYELAETEQGGYGEILARYVALRSGRALPGKLPKSQTSPYQEFAGMFSGKPSPARFEALDAAKSPYEKAVVQSEIDFFMGIYLRYVAKDEAAATARFRKLANMPWYGSVEQELARFELEKMN